ncbi:MAG: serine/threonine-protein phosphatase 6 regulatory ankyrin repeat subunit A-like [Pedosphaera sp.]|nr:serine/threonine-protein phosphatase 6 regulatory ankyrin repeat subunit A-like [Pedosphaera sp.]
MSELSAFERAVEKNRVEAVKRFLKAGETPEPEALFLAIEYNANDVLALLIKAGLNLNVLHFYWKFTPLLYALDVRNRTALKMLLKAGASVHKLGRFGAPLHAAATEGLVEETKLLIAAGAKLEQRYGPIEHRPLLLATHMGHLPVVKVLLKAGADPLAMDALDRIAYDRAVEEKEDKIARLLAPVSQRTPPIKTGPTALHEAVSNQDMAAVDKCLAAGVDPNGTDKFGRSPFIKAIDLGSVAIIKRLIKAGTKLNKVSRNGSSFLDCAVRSGQREIAKLLLEAGAVPNPPGSKCPDPLSSACAVDDLELARLLISKGSVARGSGSLGYAADKKTVELVRLLLAEGADVNEVDAQQGWTPLFCAVFVPPVVYTQKKFRSGSTLLSIQPAPKPPEGGRVDEVVKLLLEHGADVNRADDMGRTPLTHASSVSVARILIEAGARLDVRDKQGHSVSYWLKKNGVAKALRPADRSLTKSKPLAKRRVSKPKKRTRAA